MNKKRCRVWGILLMGVSLILITLFLCHTDVLALSDAKVTEILVKNKKLFTNNSIAGSVLRTIGWGLLYILALLASACADLYDTCFGFVDFTSYGKVTAFIESFKPVFGALICASLVFLGILLIFWHDKKPKFVMNLVIAVLVVSSSSFIINSMNGFLASDVRSGIMGNNKASGTVYETIGSNIHDLLYLDAKVGLDNLNGMTDGINNSDITYDSFTEEQFMTLNVNETVDGDSVKEESKDIVEQEVEMKYEDLKTVYSIKEVYDGVAWTDLLNEYYYRYTVDWFVVYLELLSLIIVYLFMSYKVIRLLFEIVVHRLLAYLYSANLTNNQKILKILDSLKDSYIVLIMTMVCIKLYLLSCKFISGWQISGISKGIILLFIAFVVIDGPNLIQKLTGIDAGLSDGMGKLMTMFYGSQMASSVVRSGARVIGAGAGAVGKGGSFIKERMGNKSGGGKSALDDSLKSDDGKMPDEMAHDGNTETPDQNQNAENRGGDKFNQNDNSNSQSEMESVNEQNNVVPDSNTESGKDLSGQGSEEFSQPANPEQDGKMPDEMAHDGNAESPFADDGKEKDGRKDSGSSAMKQDPNTHNPNYQMDNIGKDLQGKADALNGMQPAGKESPAEELKHMEEELGRDGTEIFSPDHEAGKPLDTKGNILSQKKPLVSERGQSAENRMAREVLKSGLEKSGGEE